MPSELMKDKRFSRDQEQSPEARSHRLTTRRSFGQKFGIFTWVENFLNRTLEWRLGTWISKLRSQGVMSLKISLWTGREWGLSDSLGESVAVRLLSVKAIPKLIEPSLSNLAEAYVEGFIDVDANLPDLIAMAHQLARRTLKAEGVWGRISHRYSHSKADDKSAIASHYDLSNDFYSLWLDPEMVYSCAYFETGTETLAQAQTKKLDHILRKIQAKPNDRLLDIGCGWGALVIRAAQNFGCFCVGITLSERQFQFASERVRALGLQDRVEIRLQDYRDIRGEFDRITSVGMFEHVGVTQLPAYFSVIQKLLTQDGLAMNHGITSSDPDDGQTAYGGGDFIAKYVFPGGELAHIGTVLTAMQRGGLEVRDVESLRRHYARTLLDWGSVFEENAIKIKAMVGEKSYRIWRIYLFGCAYAFEQDEISLFQVVCGKAGLPAEQHTWSRKFVYQTIQ
jgi:cyclopropane-fatty-acyl-phospholipid synthase